MRVTINRGGVHIWTWTWTTLLKEIRKNSDGRLGMGFEISQIDWQKHSAAE